MGPKQKEIRTWLNVEQKMVLTETKHDFILSRGRRECKLFKLKNLYYSPMHWCVSVCVCLSGPPVKHKALPILLL